MPGWPVLILPVRCRDLWEAKFPGLATWPPSRPCPPPPSSWGQFELTQPHRRRRRRRRTRQARRAGPAASTPDGRGADVTAHAPVRDPTARNGMKRLNFRAVGSIPESTGPQRQHSRGRSSRRVESQLAAASSMFRCRFRAWATRESIEKLGTCPPFSMAEMTDCLVFMRRASSA